MSCACERRSEAHEAARAVINMRKAGLYRCQHCKAGKRIGECPLCDALLVEAIAETITNHAGQTLARHEEYCR